MLVALFALLACADDVAKDKPMAEVAPAAPAAPAAPPAPAAPAAPVAGGLALDKARSSVKAVGAKVTGSHELVFGDFDGSLRLDGEALAGVEVKVKVGSVTTDSEKLVGHLKTEDFFAVDQFPEASFSSSAITPGGDAGATHTVKGTLTLRGVSKELSFPATIAVKPDAVEGHAEFGINRADFGIVYPGKPDNLIQDNVVLKIDLVAPRAATP